jgi:MFS family permease
LRRYDSSTDGDLSELSTNPKQGLRAHFHTMVGGLPRAYWVLWWGMFVNRMGSFVIPFLTLYLTSERHFSVVQAGLVASAYGAGGMLASPLGGYLADHIGRRRTMVAALSMGGVGMMALGFVHRLDHLALACFLVAIPYEGFRPAFQAAVADLVGPKDRVRAFGLNYWVINLGFSIGLTLGGFLASKSFLWLFVGDGFTSLVFAFLVLRFVPETRPALTQQQQAHPERGLLQGFLAPYRDVPYAIFLALSVCILGIFLQHTTTMAVDMSRHGISRAAYGSIIAINGILIVLVQPMSGPWLSRMGRSQVLAAGTLMMGVGFGLNRFAHSAPQYIAGVIAWTLGEICVLPVANAVVADIARPELRGRYQGAYGLTWAIAACSAPVVGTSVLQHFGADALWTGCFVLATLVAIGQLALAPALRRLRHERMNAGTAGGH